MRYFIDTEFIEDGETIKLLSLAIVADNGRAFYGEANWTDHDEASDWVKENVLPEMRGPQDGYTVMSRTRMIINVLRFIEENGQPTEFWADYGAYDWVVLCQLFGTMMDLPDGWPMYCNDLQQVLRAYPSLKPLLKECNVHDALAEAYWLRESVHTIDSAMKISCAAAL